MYKNVYIIADIEGSSGCLDYEGSSFKTESWADACIDMSLDVAAVADSLFKSGVDKIYVKDFHRTAYNLIPELIDEKVQIISGYSSEPVFGLGSPFDADALMFMGMHSSSGSSGFLPHTLTSKHDHIRVNGRNISEFQLFASSLSEYALSPVFFFGCPVACREVLDEVPNITTFPVSGKGMPLFEKDKFRKELGVRAAKSLYNISASPYSMKPPFKAEVKVRDGEKSAAAISKRWNLERNGDLIYFTAENFTDFYTWLILISYLSPLTEKFITPGLALFNLYGKWGQSWVRKRRKKEIEALSRY